MNRNSLPPSLVANLQQVLNKKITELPQQKVVDDAKQQLTEPSELTHSNDQQPALPSCTSAIDAENKRLKPVVLVTNADGIESQGLVSLVDGLVRDGRFDVHVCAPQFDKSTSGHSLTVRESVEVSSVEIRGATAAFEVSGTPADCVSLALSQVLFSGAKPVLVISGINRGSNCGQNVFYSGAIAGAREALICGVPSLCISMDCKNDVSSKNDFKDAVDTCLPLINAAVRDIEKGSFPTNCFLNIEIPVSPSTNKGFKLTKQSTRRSGLSWRAVSSYKRPSATNFMGNQYSLGIQLAHLGRDASAAGAARRLNANRKNIEVDSVGISGKQESQQITRKHYRLELGDEDKGDEEEDVDLTAVESGFVAITPLTLSFDNQLEIHSSVSKWLSLALGEEQ